MNTFITDNFLLKNDTARALYFDHAARMPIIDYHNHLSPEEIANDHVFENITQAWIKGDHYKWRAMRANGIPEKFITGNATDKEKFEKWAATIPYTMRNPLYHWSHLELLRYFNIDKLLNASNAGSIYDETSEQINQKSNSARQLLAKMNVEVVCTTDDPMDRLEYHDNLANGGSGLKVLPGFRPDKFILIERPSFKVATVKLRKITRRTINGFNDLLEALQDRIDYFHEHGCRLADHGLTQIFAVDFKESTLDHIYTQATTGQTLSPAEVITFKSAIMFHLARMYAKKGWTMQLHLGAIRNNNTRLKATLGDDIGCDSVGDYPQAVTLSKFLGQLDKEGKLVKTILYNLNPADNEVFATMAGNFNDGSMPGKIQWGAAWWFLDQKSGMEDQLNVLSNMGLLSRFIGMLTDSRSFLSFPRHEYFRRILCNLIGTDVEQGLLPNDTKWLGEIVEGICYKNAKAYFDF